MSFFSIRPDRERTSGWQILRMFDVPFYVEPGHLLLMAYVFYIMYRGDGDFAYGLLACFVVFISILLHEAGHAFACRCFGQRGVTVTLQMLGGMTFHTPSTPGKNLAITLAGPLVTLLLGLGGLALGMYTPAMNLGAGIAALIQLFVWINLVLFIWNMLPIFPQDGGQTILHLLNLKLSYVRALRFTAQLSVVVAVVVGLLALQYQIVGIFGIFLLASMVFTNMEIIKQSR